MYACVHNLKEEIVYAVRIQFEKGNCLRTAETIVERLFQQANSRFFVYGIITAKRYNY